LHGRRRLRRHGRDRGSREEAGQPDRRRQGDGDPEVDEAQFAARADRDRPGHARHRADRVRAARGEARRRIVERRVRQVHRREGPRQINLLGVLFDGIAYGSLLFIVSLGLSVTMGLMNFVNLAHGAFAMAGGYVCVVAMTRFGVPFLAALPVAFVVTAAAGALLERTLYRRLYTASHLDQVLFSIGLTFMAIA